MLRAAVASLALGLAACGGGGEVTLPRMDTATKTAPSMHSQSISVEISQQGGVMLDGTPVTMTDLPSALTDKYGDLSERRIYLRVHAEAPYGKVMMIMERLQATGAKLSLVTDTAGGK